MENQRLADVVPLPWVRLFLSFSSSSVAFRVQVNATQSLCHPVNLPPLACLAQGGVCRLLCDEPDPVG